MLKKQTERGATPSHSNKQVTGQAGEQAVVAWLEQHGYRVLETNYRSRYGEIDIIAQQDNTVSFIEVKKRLSDHFSLSSVITRSKQEKNIKTALWYLAKNKNALYVYRFDVALVQDVHGCTDITYIENAYTTEKISW